MLLKMKIIDKGKLDKLILADLFILGEIKYYKGKPL